MNTKSILVVDDETEIAELLSMVFADRGWTVFTASNGRQGLEIALEKRPSVILSDVNMPQMDGLQFLEEVYRHELGIPMILLTGFRDSEKMQRAWQACAFEVLDKPIRADRLIRIAESAFELGAEYVAMARRRFEKAAAAA